MDKLLSSLSWHRVSLNLTNIRNVYAREHPLSIFEGVFKESAGMRGREVNIEYIFRTPRYTPTVRTQKNRVYPLELIFFRSNTAQIEKFLANLKLHLQNPRNNFSCMIDSAVQKRCYDDLVREQTSLSPECEEICLDFHTPFPFTPTGERDNSKYRRNFLAGEEFFTILRNRILRAFALPDNSLTLPATDNIHILPYYWNYQQFSHTPKSNVGRKELLNGTIGPLYIKGEVHRIYPLVLLCSEINGSRRPAKGRGCFTLHRSCNYFDRKLQSFSFLKNTFSRLKQESDLSEELQVELVEPDSFLRSCHKKIVAGEYVPSSFSGFNLTKKSGGSRLIATADPVDQLVLKMLHTLLRSTLDRMFEDCSIGFRRGRSRTLARRAITKAVQAGYTYIFESDIQTFFDDIDWDILLTRLRSVLPLADRLTLSLLEQFITAKLEIDNTEQSRDRGLIQGMALSPMLANLYLDTFDEQMTMLGYFLVRYGDDFVVMSKTRQEAEQAREHANAILERLQLRLHPDKSAITRFDAGFSFLGFDFAPGLDEEFIDRAALRKTLFFRNRYAFLGIDSDSIVVREKNRTVATFPINRVGEIVVFGNNTVSARLLHRCGRTRIPVSFCLAGGRYVSTLRPDSKKHFELSALHTERFNALPEQARLETARQIVNAKLGGYIDWLGKRYGGQAKDICSLLRARTEVLANAKSVESVRGYEGEAAGRVYAFLRNKVIDEFFTLRERKPRAKSDPANVLLDFASFMFFSRINVLLRSQGLNPYLGFLHSHQDNYESLVCDLQEPFRARTDRFVLKCINRKIIRPEHFQSSEGKYSLTRQGIGVFLEAFEKELSIKLRGDGGNLKQLLVAQVQVIRMWTLDKQQDLFFYRP